MAQMRLFKFLSSLDEEEWTSFGKFLQSPFFTQKKEPYELIRLVRAQKSFPELTTADEERCMRKLWQKSPDDAGIRNRWLRLLSETSLLLERFLAVEKLLSSPLDRQLYTTERLLEKRDKESLQISLSKLDSLLEEERVDLHCYHVSWRRWMIYFSSPLYSSYYIKTDTAQRYYEVLEQKCFEEYCLKLLIVRNSVSSIKPLLGVSLDDPRLSNKQLLEATAAFDATHHPLHYLYRRFLLIAESGPTPALLEDIYREMLRLQQRISPLELIPLSMLGLNASFALRKYADTYDYFGAMRKFTDMVIVAAGQLERCSISEIVYSQLCLSVMSTRDELQYFQVKKAMAPLLQQNIASSIIHLMDAYFFFAVGQFDKALLMLDQVKNNSIDFAVRVQSLNLRVLFEKFIENPMDDEPLLLKLDSYKKFINRRAARLLSPERQQQYINMHDLLKSATTILQRGKDTRRQLLQLLEEAKLRPTPVQYWIFDKLQKLIDSSAS